MQLATSSDSARLIQANNNCIAVKWTGNGGSIGLLPLDKTGKGCASETRVFQAHGGASITDWEFAPFQEHLLATGAEDGMIKLWDISTVSDNQPACVSTISLPSRKVAALGFHPTADNLLSTLGNEGKTLCIWDIQSSDQPSLEIKNTSPNPFQSFSWKSDGRLLSTIAKSSLTLWDPRANEAQLSSGTGHEGIKGSRVVWLGESNYLFSVGQSKFRSREYAVWDARNMAKPFKKTTLDTSSGIMLPLYDQDTETMYLVSRGDATIHTIQFSDLATTPSLAENQPCGTSAPIYGATLLPKQSLRVMETEIARILAVVDNGVMPVSFHVPRKQYIDFHADLYPDTKGNEPGVTSQDWLAGKDGQVPKVSLRPGQQQSPQQSKSNTTTPTEPVSASTSTPAPVASTPTPKSTSAPAPPATQEKTDNNTNIQKNDTKPETITTASKQDTTDKTSETPSSQQTSTKPKTLPKYGAAKINTFKYLYGKLIHPSYDDLRDLSIDKAGISELIQASADFIAVPIAGAGGRIGIIQQVEKPSRLPTHLPCVVCGSPVTYFVFDPFDSHKLITASEDGVIRIWKLSYKEDDIAFDMVKSLKDPNMDKISHILPHPNAQGVLLSASNDLEGAVVRIWDVDNEEGKIKFAITASPLSVAWSPDGNKVAVHSKDKHLQIYDVRSGTLIGKTKSHDGIRPSRIMWMDDHRLVSVGFGAGSMREVLVYDINQFDKHIAKKMLDVSPSVMSAYYDPDCKILYVAGRGDRIIHTISINGKELESLSPVECGSLQQGFAFLHKRLCKVDQVEIARFLRLTPTSIERHGIRVPRARPEFFQDDIFIDTSDVEHPAQDASTWFDGVDKPLSKISLKPDQMTSLSDAPPPQHANANNHAKQLMDITTTHEHRENAMDAMFASAKNVDDDDHEK